jgi:mono/diheme cytochrome c family protein
MKKVNQVKLICLAGSLLVYAAGYVAPRMAGASDRPAATARAVSLKNSLPAETRAQDHKTVDFINEIQPIFKAACYQCHGGKNAKGGLRLDAKTQALRGGVSGPAIIPGKSRESLLVQRISGEEKGPRMPLGGEPLTAAQVDLIRVWIDQGAGWPDEASAGAQSVAAETGDQPATNKPIDGPRPAEAAAGPVSEEGPGSQTISFNRDIRPIMSDTCFRCHGPDKNARQAGLRLDLREEATRQTKSGIIPIVPGQPDKSEIIRRIFSTDENEVMPPRYAHKELTAKQKETIRRWVAEGAKYEGHWAYQPIKRPEVPAVPANKNAPVRNPIDAFVQARLAKEGLEPSPEADRRTLIRRVSLDLTGIPPEPREIEAFVNDPAPDAYEKLVDRLLASPRFAEKQAIHWLDAVRYADTAGFHGDNALPVWPYRDYVLRALRDNKPFDQFTREQLAGDLLPNATTEQKIASAFNRLNRTSAEGGIQPKEYLAKYAADRVRTTSAVWLGATMGCCECHDHKFDPFLTKDFYAMKAFFADIKETGLVPDRGRDAWGTKLMLPTAEQKRRLDELNALLTKAQRELDDRAQSLAAQRAEWEKQTLGAHAAGKLEWRFQRPVSARSARGAQLTIYNDEPLTVTVYRGGSVITERIIGDGLVVASGPNPEQETYTVRFKPGAGSWTALGVQVVQDESLPADRFARGADRFVLTEVEAEMSAASRGPAQKVRFVLATTDGFGEQPENPAMAAIDGNPRTGWGVMHGDGRDAFIALRFAGRLETRADSVITVRLRQESNIRRATIGRFRLALSAAQYSWPDHAAKTDKPLRGLPADVLAGLKVPEDKRTEAQKKAVASYFKWSQPDLEPLVARVAELEAARDMFEAAIPRVVVTESTTPRETRVLPRGNWMDDSGEVVEPAIPAIFGKLNTGQRRATRLDLANWIVSKDNPLTARVFVNRLWRQFFGIGLSKVLDDLGSQGEWPTHPELLDWLASEFMTPRWQAPTEKEPAHDWDIKHIIRAIVTSHTYRQSSLSNPQLDERDPDNRLLARQSRFRVDAEVVRDIALAVSGLLVEKFGGPSVRPVQPDGYLAALNFPKRDYAADRGPDLYRRGLYTHWQRTFLHPSLLTFDAPSREECTVNRVNSNTPLQALVLLNDPIYTEAARVFAQNILQQGGGALGQQINWAFQRATGRQPGADERRVLVDLYTQSWLRYRRDPASARALTSAGEYPQAKGLNGARLAAMTVVARTILNLHETITRN